MKTQDKIKYSIRFNNLTDDQRKSLSLLLHTRIEDMKNQNNKKETENNATSISNINEPEKHMEELGTIYKNSESFLEPKTPVKEALFRLFVYNNNKPLTVRQISKQLSELWEMSQFVTKCFRLLYTTIWKKILYKKILVLTNIFYGRNN